MDRKKIIWMVLFLVLAVLSIFAVVSQSKSFSVEMFYNDIRTAKTGWLILAVISMLGFIIFEGLAIHCIVKGITGTGKVRSGFLYSSADIYFSAITPSATGGQPASAFFMMRNGIPGPIVTVTLLLNLIMYTLALLAIGVISLIVSPTIILDFGPLSKIFILAGSLVIVVLGLVFLMLLKKEKIVHSICDKLIQLGAKLHLIRHVDRKQAKLHKAMEEYKECVRIAHGKTKMLFLAFFYNFMQRASVVCVTVFVYLATGGSLDKVFDVWALQSFTTIGSNCVPIPGAMGVADYLLIDGFSSMPDIASPANLELFCRSLSFYCLIIFSAAITLIGYLAQRRRKNK